MNEANLARQVESSDEPDRVRAISVPLRPALRVVQRAAPVVRLRRRKPFRLEFLDSGYRPFRVR